MKVLILAGGYGTRLSEETMIRPKPMVEIGDKPILWHIMKGYSHYGFHEFIILLGYKGYMIKEYFANYFLHQSDVTIDLSNNQIEVHNNTSESWKVTLLDTGRDSMTGGRILRTQRFVGDEPFMLTYGDGVSDINLHDLLKFHQSHGKLVTVTTLRPEGRYGTVGCEQDGRIQTFLEKPKGNGAWISCGFFICQPEVFNYLNEGDKTIFEHGPLETMAKEGQFYAYKHYGFWKCMDTLRDKVQLNKLWVDNQAKWKVWDEILLGQTCK